MLRAEEGVERTPAVEQEFVGGVGTLDGFEWRSGSNTTYAGWVKGEG
jgi:hypothetical protein